MANKTVTYQDKDVVIYYDVNKNTPSGFEFFGVTYQDDETGTVEWATPDEDVWQWAEVEIEGVAADSMENAPEVPVGYFESLLEHTE